MRIRRSSKPKRSVQWRGLGNIIFSVIVLSTCFSTVIVLRSILFGNDVAEEEEMISIIVRTEEHPEEETSPVAIIGSDNPGTWDSRGATIGARNMTNNTMMTPGGGATARRRSRAHWCWWRAHMFRGMSILQDEFGFQTVDAMADDEDWDMIFGGYPHCGSNNRQDRNMDWEMERGLNAHLTNNVGWENLKPHQVWFPCMGCKESYCNKRELCSSTKLYDENSCFELPQDLDRLKKIMANQSEGEQERTKWVVKRDSPTLHAHKGTGIQYIETTTQLPDETEMATNEYVVQPFVQQAMGKGKYHRRFEVRVLLAVTSTAPLRAYKFRKPWGIFAFEEYKHGTELHSRPCMLDTHTHTKGCESKGMLDSERGPWSLEKIFSLMEASDSIQRRFNQSSSERLAQVIQASQPVVTSHIVNKGITKSGAMCFSFMRADMAVMPDGTASIYEINEFPFVNEKAPILQTTIGDAYRDLFRMIGLDVPPIPAELRGAYERTHLGGWIPLINNEN